MDKKLPFRHRHAPLCCGLLLAQEWGFAARLLGAAGRCAQSVACSLACRAPRVSSAPEGKQTKRHQCLTPKQLWHICLFLTTGLHSSLRRGMTERVLFRNRASGKQNYCCFKLCIFSQCKCHFQSLLACGGSSLLPTPPFSLCLA